MEDIQARIEQICDTLKDQTTHEWTFRMETVTSLGDLVNNCVKLDGFAQMFSSNDLIFKVLCIQVF